MVTIASATSSTQRMCLHRARKQRGLRCVTLEIRQEEIGALVRKGLLAAGTEHDAGAVRYALYSLLDRLLGGA